MTRNHLAPSQGDDSLEASRNSISDPPGLPLALNPDTVNLLLWLAFVQVPVLILNHRRIGLPDHLGDLEGREPAVDQPYDAATSTGTAFAPSLAWSVMTASSSRSPGNRSA